MRVFLCLNYASFGLAYLDAVHYYSFLFLNKKSINLHFLNFFFIFYFYYSMKDCKSYSIFATIAAAVDLTFLTLGNSKFALFSQNAFKMNEDL